MVICNRQGKPIREVTWGCLSFGDSPLEALMTGTSSQTARVSTARWGLKEAEGKSLAQGTRTAYEAITGGRGSVGVRSPKSSRTGGRRRGGHGEKVTRLTLGDLSICLCGQSLPRGGENGGQKSAEGIVGRRIGRRPEQADTNRYRGLDGPIRRS